MTHRVFIAVLLGLWAATASAGERPLTVVELYTSQGCSSCPPADAFLGDLAQRDDVLALSFHVGYWDYIGWKDPFASESNLRRQLAYRDTFGSGFVYTPQLVVNGSTDLPGNDRDAALEAVARSGDRPRLPVSAKVVDGARTVVAVGGRDTPGHATIWLVSFLPKAETVVRRGENGGNILVNHNVVRDVRPIGQWDGRATAVEAPLPPVPHGERRSMAVLVQADSAGPILGAALVKATGE